MDYEKTCKAQGIKTKLVVAEKQVNKVVAEKEVETPDPEKGAAAKILKENEVPVKKAK